MPKALFYSSTGPSFQCLLNSRSCENGALKPAYNRSMTKQFLQSPPSDTHKLGEFDLIRDIFTTRAAQMMKAKPQYAPLLGIGDDGAVIASRPNQELVITTDMLVADRHFFTDADPYLVGKKSLAVNLSDLAAMGAKPTGFTLALALPKQKQAWLHGFANGLFDLADLFDCHLIGGDTCQGPLTISITAFGVVPNGQAIKRSGARVGDSIWVSGELGDARLALGYLRKEWSLDLEPEELNRINQRLHCPLPRVALGIALRGIATSALDISDGLLGDLRHILEASHVGAQINLEALPRSQVLRRQVEAIQYQCATSGGDDYELCFTANPNQHDNIKNLSKELGLPLTCIGQITEAQDENLLILQDSDGIPLSPEKSQALQRSFDHFRE